MRDQARRLQAGVLDPTRSRERIDVGRAVPPPGLADTVDYLWWVTWHAPDGYVQEVIPRPVVHVVAEPVAGAARLRVTGVQRRRFVRTLVGEDRGVAAAFRPGGFRPFFGRSVSELRDREIDAHEVWDDVPADLAERLVDRGRPAAAAADELAQWLDGRPRADDRLVDELATLVERVEVDATITRAEQVATLGGMSLRTLQRRFVDYVGIGPKWVVQRCRLLDVAAAAHTGGDVDWAQLAADLGYSDQSHLTRAFRALVGRPPAAYVAAVAPSRTS